MRTEDGDSQIACALVGGRTSVLHTTFTNLRVRLFHGDTAVTDLAVMHTREVHGGDVLTVRVEDHFAGYTLVVGKPGESVANAAFVQTGSADGVQENFHLIVGQRGKVVRAFVIAGFGLGGELQPARIGSRRIVRVQLLETFSRGASQ